MKKLIAVLLSLAMLLGVLAGCGESAAAESSAQDSTNAAAASADDSSGETADDGAAGAAEPAEDSSAEPAGNLESAVSFPLEENVSFTIFYPFAPPLIQMGYEDPAELLFFKTLEEKTNVTLEFQVASVEVLSENFSLLVAGGDYPDIFSQCADEYNGGAAAMVEDEVIIDLAGYMEEYAPNYSALLESDPDFKKANYTDDGALTRFMSYYKDSYVNQGYFVRTDWLEELGLDSPVTYDDWFDVLSAFKSEYNVSTPSTGVPTTAFFGFTSNNFAVRDGEVIYVYADDEIQSQLLPLCEKWFNAGLYTVEAVIDGYYTDSDLRGMVTSSDLVLTSCDVDQYLVFQSEVEISAVELPVLEEGDTPYQLVNQDPFGGGNMISTACSDVETLVAYMDYWYTDEIIELANWGIENETYTVDADGNYSYTDEVLNFAGGLNLATSVYCAGWEPTVIDFRRKDAAYNEDQLSALEIWNVFDSSMNYPRFTSFTTEEQTVIQTTFADIDTYVDEHYTQFQIGTLTYETDYAAFVETLYSMGLQDVIDVYQAAYDRYMDR